MYHIAEVKNINKIKKKKQSNERIYACKAQLYAVHDNYTPRAGRLRVPCKTRRRGGQGSTKTWSTKLGNPCVA